MCEDCGVLHERLKEMSYELFQVKRACSNLQKDLRKERREKGKLVKDRKEQHHYRNGQKRGRNGRNG